MKKKILTVVGARPQIIKSSAISRAISKYYNNDIEELIIHTGQHYDNNMSKVFFDEMMIPFPSFNLNVGSGSHAIQTASMLKGLEEIFIQEKPTAVLVYGDTNSTLAASLAAVKIHVPVIHVEAGLRSFNKYMPEEINRISCDHMSSMLFTPTKKGLDNLTSEGFKSKQTGLASINNPHVYYCGDIMFDNSIYFSEISENSSSIVSDLNLEPNNFILCTVHRDLNTDVQDKMESIFSALLEIVNITGLKLVLPLHPRTRVRLEYQLSENLFNEVNQSKMISLMEPVGFIDMISLEKNAKIIVTDSGGVQKESFFFKKPCVILRPETEWVEIVNNGNAILTDSNYDTIIKSFNLLLSRTDYTYPNFYGDGNASEFICNKIVTHL